MTTGENSFFRQLDYMVASIGIIDFKLLYDISDVSTYAKLKDQIFAKYRATAEILGILLVKESRKKNMNVLVETSGRDVAMFDYMNYCFPSDQYNKLVIHFTVNDIGFAQASVDTRMLNEMKLGKEALRVRVL
jgi:hypothetical protein